MIDGGADNYCRERDWHNPALTDLDLRLLHEVYLLPLDSGLHQNKADIKLAFLINLFVFPDPDLSLLGLAQPPQRHQCLHY